jgi:hypothetical protein
MKYRTKDCECLPVIVGVGGKRPDTCPCGNRYLTEREYAKFGPRTYTPEQAKVITQVVKQRKPLKRTRRKETKAEREARHHFNAEVKRRGCWFADSRPCEECGGSGWWSDWNGEEGGAGECGLCHGDGKHRCGGGRLDAHHLVPKDFLRKRFQGILPESELVAILFNPKIGAPLCRKAHDRIEAGFDRIYWEDLTEECVEYVFSLPDFMALRLEEECPKRPNSNDELEAA